MRNELGDDLQINWRSFALEQVNSKEDEDWKAWEQDSDYTSRGLWALRGGIEEDGKLALSQGNSNAVWLVRRAGVFNLVHRTFVLSVLEQ